MCASIGIFNEKKSSLTQIIGLKKAFNTFKFRLSRRCLTLSKSEL